MTISSVNTDPAASDMAVPRFIASDIQQSEPQANGLMPTQTPMSGVRPPAIKQPATGAVIPSANQVSNLTGTVGNAAKTMISNVPAPNPPSSAKKLGQELMEAGTDLVSNHPFLVYSALGGIAAGAGKVAYDKHTHPWFKENKESVIENRKEPVLEVEKPTIEKPEAVLKEKEKTLSELADKMPVNNEQLKTGQDILNLTNQPNPSVSNNPVESGDNANPLKDPGADSGKSQLETTQESTNQEQPKVEPAIGEKKLGTEPRQNLTHEQWTEHLKNPEIRKNVEDLFKTNNPEQELSIALNRGGLSEKEEQAILTGEGKDMYSNKSSEKNTTKESGNLTNPAENPTQGGVEQVKKEVKGAVVPRRSKQETQIANEEMRFNKYYNQVANRLAGTENLKEHPHITEQFDKAWEDVFHNVLGGKMEKSQGGAPAKIHEIEAHINANPEKYPDLVKYMSEAKQYAKGNINPKEGGFSHIGAMLGMLGAGGLGAYMVNRYGNPFQESMKKANEAMGEATGTQDLGKANKAEELSPAMRAIFTKASNPVYRKEINQQLATEKNPERIKELKRELEKAK